MASLAVAQIAIGAAAIFARFALDGGAGPLATSAARLTIAALPLVLVAMFHRTHTPLAVADARRMFVAGLLLAAHFAAWISSLRYASVAVATLLVCTTPLWTEAWTIARMRRARPDVLASVIIGITGVAIVAGVPSRTEMPLGILLALAGAVAIAGYLTIVGASSDRIGTRAVVSRTYPVAALALIAVAVALRDPLPPPHDARAWGGIIAMGLFSQLLGHTALNAAVRTFGATFVGTVTLIEPVVAALLAALMLGERLAPTTLAGGAVVLAGIGLAVRAQRYDASPSSLSA